MSVQDKKDLKAILDTYISMAETENATFKNKEIREHGAKWITKAKDLQKKLCS